jgi:adenylate kinase family enzyme
MDRDIILIKGAPGSRSESLSRKLANEHYSQLFVEHISIETIMRSLGRAAITTSDQDMYDIVGNALTRHDNTGLILLNGYPQTVSQVDDLYELAMLDGRRLSGLIVTDTSKENTIMNIIGEQHSMLTVADAEMILSDYHQRHDPIILELRCRDLPLQFIDTSRPEAEIIHDGVHIIKYFLALDDTDEKNTPK